MAKLSSTEIYGNLYVEGSILGTAEKATKLATGRTLTIGNTSKTFDGSGNLSWSLSEIGAAAASHGTHLTLGTGSGNAYRGDYGNTAYNHSQAAHAPSNAQKNSDITKSEIEAKLTGTITSHNHNTFTAVSGSGWTSATRNITDDCKFEFASHVNKDVTGKFPCGNNANAIISFNKHSGNYASQLGFSNNGNIYYRSADGADLTDSTAWQTIYTTSNKPTPADIGAATSSHGTHVTYSTSAPLVAGTASAGSANNVSRGDHVHPAQTSVSGNAGTATKLATARTITIGDKSNKFDGSGNISFTVSDIGAAAKSHGYHVPDPQSANNAKFLRNDNTWQTVTPGNIGAAKSDHTHSYAGSGSAGGSANSAVKLATARTINGTSFDGSGNITTTNWGTARTLTIGDKGQSVNGSGNVTWSLNDIGAASRKPYNNTSVEVTVAGNANTYYPVLVKIEKPNIGYPYYNISISRQYSATAPDTWNTSTHRGGLTLAVRWTGDSSWGGNDHNLTVEEFHESYCTMVAGLKMCTDGMIVWLRGGTAKYQFNCEQGIGLTATVTLGTYTDAGGSSFAVRTNTDNVTNEIKKLWSTRNGALYDNNNRVYSPGNKPTPADIGAAASSHGTHLSLGTTSSTAFRGDYGNTAYTHSQAAHAPSNAQKNSDITKAEIEAKLTGTITSHNHSGTYAPASHNHTSLTDITSLTFGANSDDSSIIKITKDSTTSYTDFIMSDDAGSDMWRWRFKAWDSSASASTAEYNLMTLKATSTTKGQLSINGNVTADSFTEGGTALSSKYAAASHGTHVSYGGNGSATTVSRSDHTHSYLPLGGGTMTGTITTPNNAQGIIVGDDATICDRNIANHIVIEGATATSGGITFGSGKDTNIYRGGANLLKTDDTFNAVGGFQWNGTSLDDRYAPKSHTHDYAASSHSHTSINYQDTRAVNTTPNDMPGGLSVHLKSNGTDSLSDGGSYHSTLMIKGWNDYSGGPWSQLTITNNGNLCFRTSTSGTAWGAWKKTLNEITESELNTIFTNVGI